MGKTVPPAATSGNMSKSKNPLEIITRVIYRDLESDERFILLTRALLETYPASGSLVYLDADGRGEVFLLDAGQSLPQRFFELEPAWEQGLIETCLQKREATLKLAPEPDTLPETLRQRKPGTVCCAPVYFGEHSFGALALWDPVEGEAAFAGLREIAHALGHKLHTEREIQQLKVANARLEVNRWQLLHSRNILRALFDSIPISMYIIDRKFNLAAVNMERAKRTSQAPSQLVGRRCYEALYGLYDPCPDCRVLDTLFGGETLNRTKREWESNLDPQEWEISSYPIHDDNEQVVQAILLEEDVTDRRRLEATLAQSEKLAAVGQLAAGLAHEINNPLTAVIANAQLLKRDLPKADEDTQEMIDLILRAGERASQVVRNLLDLARREQYDLAPIDVNETIRKALALLHHEFVSQSVELVFDAQPDLPRLTASPDHLQGVWINLLSNAMDALQDEPRRVQVTSRLQGNEIQVIIADSGQGIPPQTLSRIFEPFYTTKEPGRGTGLGLSMCHRIVKQHGGRILVDSQIDIGTQFTVILPLN